MIEFLVIHKTENIKGLNIETKGDTKRQYISSLNVYVILLPSTYHINLPWI